MNAIHRFDQKAILNELLLVDQRKSEIKLLLTRLRISGMTTALRPILYPPDNYNYYNFFFFYFYYYYLFIIIDHCTEALTASVRPINSQSSCTLTGQWHCQYCQCVGLKMEVFFSLTYCKYFA